LHLFSSLKPNYTVESRWIGTAKVGTLARGSTLGTASEKTFQLPGFLWSTPPRPDAEDFAVEYPMSVSRVLPRVDKIASSLKSRSLGRQKLTPLPALGVDGSVPWVLPRRKSSDCPDFFSCFWLTPPRPDAEALSVKSGTFASLDDFLEIFPRLI
jgi:hypothetical protein